MTKLKEILVGDYIIVDGRFECCKPGPVKVKGDFNFPGVAGLYFKCSHNGRHYLDTQEDFPGASLVGVKKLHQYWISKGKVTDLDTYDPAVDHPMPEIGDDEWLFLDGPLDKCGYCNPYLSLEAGISALSPAIFHWEK